MKKGIILVCMVTALLAAGCGGSPSMVGKTYKATLENGIISINVVMTFGATEVTMSTKLFDPQAITYPYSLTGDTVTIYPAEGTNSSDSEDLKLTDGGKVLTGPDDVAYHRQ